MSTILATGAIGLIGSRFAQLYRDDYTIDNIDILSGVDITQKDSVAQFVSKHKASVMIHLAAFSDTARASEQDGQQDGSCYQVNVIGTKNIAQVCRESGIHLIHISTDFVFDGANPPEGGYTEDSLPNPLDWYGKTKLMSEEVVKKAGVSYTIVRLSYPYRATFPGKPDIIQKIRQGLEAGTLPPQFSDTLITPTFIDDIARGFAKLIETRPTGTFHFVGSDSLSPYALAQQVAEAYGYDQSLVKEGSLTEYLSHSPRPYARRAVMSNHKATTVLGLDFATMSEGLIQIQQQQAS